LLVGNIYRSPSGDKLSSTNELCELITYVNNTKPSYLLIVGDFNYTNIDWDNDCLLRSDPSEQLFLDTIQDCVLSQLVTQRTRFRQDNESHILDLIFTNEVDMVHQIHHSAGLGSSDHVCIHFKLMRSPTTVSNTYYSYNFCKADFSRLRSLLEEIDWNTQLQGRNAHETRNLIFEHLTNFMEVCVPMTSHPVRKNHPYLNEKATKLRHIKEVAWKQYKVTGNHIGLLSSEIY